MTGQPIHQESDYLKKHLVLASALVLAGLSTTAAAADGNWFVRGEVGRSTVDVDVSGVGSDSDHDTSYSLRTGYWFNRNFAVEGFYSKFYDQDFTDGVDSANIKLSAFGLGLVGKKNFGADGNGFFIDGRAGITRGKIAVDSTFGNGSDTSTKPYIGVGAGYDFNRNLGLSLNYDHHKGSGDGLDITAKTVTFGVEYRF